MKKLGLLNLFILLLLTACRKDINEMTIKEEIPEPEIIDGYQPLVENVNSSLIGFIVDENKAPVPRAKVTLNGKTVESDDYGHFFFNDMEMNAKGTIVQVEKAGYFEGSRRFFPIENVKNRVKIEILPKIFDQSFETSAGGTITMNGGASIEFKANSIKKENGEAYEGEVQVASKWLDPSTVATFDQMPGNLQGVNTQNKEIGLATFGMMAVELQSPSGEALNIATEQTATISMPLPESMQNNAIEEIPLWSYSEEYGVWIEESVAVLENNIYVGEVSHFSFWNLDYPFDMTGVQFILETEDGERLINYRVNIEIVSGDLAGSYGVGYTDSKGGLSLFVSANSELIIKVFSICGDLLYSQSFTTTSDDMDFGTLIIPNDDAKFTSVYGNLIACDHVPVNNGLIIASFDGFAVYEYVNGGNFNLLFPTCDQTSEVDVIGIDLEEEKQSETITVLPDVATDVGELNTCDEFVLENALLVTIDGVEALFPLVTYNSDDETYISVQNTQDLDDLLLTITFKGLETGDYDGNDQNNMNIFNPERDWSVHTIVNQGIANFEVTSVGDVIEGHFSGTMHNAASGMEVPVEVTGQFSFTR